MRKASREMDAAFALDVLDKAPYITVSFTKSDGSPYGVPLSLARIDEKTFYFHGALEGDKMDCIVNNPKVALSAVTKCAPTVGPKDGSFTLQYKSAMAVPFSIIIDCKCSHHPNTLSLIVITLSGTVMLVRHLQSLYLQLVLYQLLVC